MSRFLKAIAAAWLALTGATALAEDIDLFASGLANGAAASSLPNDQANHKPSPDTSKEPPTSSKPLASRSVPATGSSSALA